MEKPGQQFSRNPSNGLQDNITKYWPIVMAVVLILGIQLGLMLAKQIPDKTPMLKSANTNKLNEILNFIDTKYVDTVNKDQLVDKVIDDLLSELDPHSFYIPKTNVENVRENLQGNFEGIGIEFYIVEDTITVVSPIAGGPSEAVGINAGDKIIIIEDTLVAGIGISNQEVVGKLRGKKGTKVNIKVKRNGSKTLLDYRITRDKIPLFSVDVGYLLDEDVGYLKINRFSATTHQEFVDKVYDLKKQGMKKLILDLRQNPGGYLEAATKIVDELLGGRKLVVYTSGKSSKRRNYMARRPGVFEEGELVVLIDQGSASASEIVAGAIQDWDRGMVMGRRSFGKGLVQDQYELKDGSALRLTVAKYYTPSGRSIQKPYNKGNDDYYNELNERIETGEYLNKDSITVFDTVAYYTANGRKVFGGGGIIPDVFIAFDSTRNYEYLSRVRSHIPEFVYKYYATHTQDFDRYRTPELFNRQFRITTSFYKSFLVYASENGLKQNDNELGLLRKDIETILKAYIARQKWNNDGYYPVINDMDNTLFTAYEYVKKGLKTELYISP